MGHGFERTRIRLERVGGFVAWSGERLEQGNDEKWLLGEYPRERRGDKTKDREHGAKENGGEGAKLENEPVG